tara:strand:- start:5379 stop:6653 length:1275 start_codon:yes stop_codon:yes gene_type:complete
MKSIINKILKNNSNLVQKFNSFIDIQKNFEVRKLFESVLEYSENSEIRFVGGCLRKIVTKEIIDDIDLATNLNPEEVIKCLKKNKIAFLETGKDHGTITAIINKQKFEITSLRKDLFTDGRHAKVQFSDNWLEDASRRDFTINCIYSDIDGNLYDPFNGKTDLVNGKIVFIGEAEKRIKEDYLRILRYIRFFINYSKIDHEPKVKRIIRQNINGVINLSKERLINELKKIVLSKGFLKLTKDEFCLEIILLIFPQLKNIKIFSSLNSYALENYFSKDFIFLLSLMIIDETDNVDYFLYKFNLSNQEKKRIIFLKNMFSKKTIDNTFSEKNLLKILYYYGKINLEDMINFQIYKSKKIDSKIIKLKDIFNKKNTPVFPVKANQLIEKYKLEENKILGQKLKEIEEIWVNNSFKITEDEIEKVVKN